MAWGCQYWFDLAKSSWSIYWSFWSQYYWGQIEDGFNWFTTFVGSIRKYFKLSSRKALAFCFKINNWLSSKLRHHRCKQQSASQHALHKSKIPCKLLCYRLRSKMFGWQRRHKIHMPRQIPCPQFIKCKLKNSLTRINRVV